MATVLSTKTQTTTTKLPVSNFDTYQSSSKQMPKCYQADQQVKYLHLQAEVDVLLQQLQTLKEQKQTLSEVAAK